MKLLREVTQDVKVISKSESSDKPKEYYIEGKFIQCEAPNRNERVYLLDNMKEEVARYVKEYVVRNRAFGELGHPANPSINLDKVSHIITSLVQEGNDFIGRAKILDTPNGKIVKAFIDAGCEFGVSTRGLGSVKTEGVHSVVQSDYKIMTAADIVADPSAQEAFVTAVVESKEWVWDNGILQEITVEEYKNRLKNASNKVQEEQINIFKDFLSKL